MMAYGGQTDEEKMGIRYSQIAEMIETGDISDKKAKEEIIRRYNSSKHKREKTPIYTFKRKNFLEREIEKMKDLEKILINVDMVNGFVKKGAMADKYIEHIIPEQIRLMEQMNNEKEAIIIIKDCHKENCMEFKKYPKHCIENTEESELVEELKNFEKDALIYKKNSTSTMYAPNFLEDISKMDNLKEVVIVGCCTDICVLNLAIPLQNYFDQNDKEIKIIVPKNAVETYNSPEHNREEYNEISFKLMKQAGINVI